MPLVNGLHSHSIKLYLGEVELLYSGIPSLVTFCAYMGTAPKSTSFKHTGVPNLVHNTLITLVKQTKL